MPAQASGDLTEKITFQKAVDADDDLGGSTRSWQNLPTDPHAWAEIVPLEGSEAIVARQQGSSQQYLVTIYARQDITSVMRILWGTRTLEIVSAPPPRSGDMMMTIKAEEKAPA